MDQQFLENLLNAAHSVHVSAALREQSRRNGGRSRGRGRPRDGNNRSRSPRGMNRRGRSERGGANGRQNISGGRQSRNRGRSVSRRRDSNNGRHSVSAGRQSSNRGRSVSPRRDSSNGRQSVSSGRDRSNRRRSVPGRRHGGSRHGDGAGTDRTNQPHVSHHDRNAYKRSIVQRQFQPLQPMHHPPKPTFCGYQLLGDSQLLRFAKQILGEDHIVSENLRCLGYCVAGQKIGDLLKRVKSNFYHMQKKIAIMIGTNDLLKGTTLIQMKEDLKNLMEHIWTLQPEDIILLTLPPVLRLEHSESHWSRLEGYNNFIRQLTQEGPNFTRIMDISSSFYDKKKQKCYKEFFELAFSGNDKEDMIHLNAAGLTMIRDKFTEEGQKDEEMIDLNATGLTNE